MTDKPSKAWLATERQRGRAADEATQPGGRSCRLVGDTNSGGTTTMWKTIDGLVDEEEQPWWDADGVMHAPSDGEEPDGD